MDHFNTEKRQSRYFFRVHQIDVLLNAPLKSESLSLAKLDQNYQVREDVYEFQGEHTHLGQKHDVTHEAVLECT